MINFKGLLFDLDGTLVNSNAVVDRAWMSWCNRNNVDFTIAKELYHGRPAGDTVKELLVGYSNEKIAEEIAWLQHQESMDVDGVIALPGTISFLDKLIAFNIPWGIITSGTLPVATARMNAAKIPQPPVLVTPEDVYRGKPDPEPYQLGASKLGLTPEQCIVFEDAPSGLIAGNASGAKMIGVLSQFELSDLPTANAYIESLIDVEVEKGSEGWFLIFK